MVMTESAFASIYRIVRAIPAGRVMSYGQVGRLCGCPARTVGWALASSPDDVPWQRVTGADGTLRVAKRSPEHGAIQKAILTREGVFFRADGSVAMEKSQFGAQDSDALTVQSNDEAIQ